MLAHTEANKRTESSTSNYPHLVFSILTKQSELGVPIVPLHSFTQIYYNADSLEIPGGVVGVIPQDCITLKCTLDHSVSCSCIPLSWEEDIADLPTNTLICSTPFGLSK